MITNHFIHQLTALEMSTLDHQPDIPQLIPTYSISTQSHDWLCHFSGNVYMYINILTIQGVVQSTNSSK